MLSDNPQQQRPATADSLAMAWRPNPGIWIRSHLMEVREDYPYHMWTLYRDYTLTLRRRPCSYATFRKYIYNLNRAHLIEHTRIEKAGTPFEAYKRYYRLNENKVDDPRWRHVQYSTDGGIS